jgi:hypothetical protein
MEPAGHTESTPGLNDSSVNLQRQKLKKSVCRKRGKFRSSLIFLGDVIATRFQNAVENGIANGL